MQRWTELGLPIVFAAGLFTACGNGSGSVKTVEAGADAPPPGDASSSGADAGSTLGDTGSGGGSDAGAADAPPNLTFVPSNVPAGSIDFATAGDCVFSTTCRLNTDDGSSNCFTGATKPYKYLAINQATAGYKAGVFICRSVRIETAGLVSVTGGLPLILVAAGDIDVVGELSATAELDKANGGGFATMDGGKMGGGPGGGAAASAGISGGGGAYCGKGGAGAAAMGMGGPGGAPFGTPELVPLLGGSGGGSNFYGGGAGGGAIHLVAGGKLSILVTGRVSAGGGGGGGHEGQAGGGGSGGALLLEAPEIVCAGSLAVNGGSGGSGSGGADGQNGQASSTPAAGAAAVGGAGSAAAVLDGGEGVKNGNNIGGGGGGAGRIRLNTRSGAAMITGPTSPTMATACVSQGMLR
jgi:hypothetical protein